MAITTMRMLWLLRASMTTTTMLRMPTACVLRFTRLQNDVSFPVFDKLLVRNYLDLRTDWFEYEGTYYPAFIFSKGETNSTFSQRIFFCGMCLKKRSSYFYPHIRSLRLLERFSSKKISSLAVEFAFSDQTQSLAFLYPTKKLFCGEQILYFVESIR